ncbi:MAG TPA: hypothetical protein VJO99_19235 [Burkholderiaceae bacterium]|nr:hypothetical protein [Burkholderiaceae bacterium]
MTAQRPARRLLRTTTIPALAILLALGATGCAGLAPGMTPLGTDIASARHSAFGPTGEYPLAGGGTRLEFAQGSFGRQTWMLDFDAAGKLVANRQVLTEANFATIAPGMPAQDVRMRLGRPAQVFNASWQKIQVWNYRYVGGDCVWFQVSIGETGQGRVTEASLGTDPACDGPKSREG